MPGVIRPYTLTDVLSTINQSAQTGGATVGVSSTVFAAIAETDESIPATSMADSATTTAATPAGWEQGVWGGIQWQ